MTPLLAANARLSTLLSLHVYKSEEFLNASAFALDSSIIPYVKSLNPFTLTRKKKKI